MYSKKNILSSIIISLIIGVLLGVLLVVLSGILDVSFLIKWGLIIIGILTIIGNIPSLVTGIINITRASGIVDLIFSVLGIVLGCMMIFNQGPIITILVSVYLIAFPIIRIILAGAMWKNQIKKEWIRILIGVLLLAFLPGIMFAADTIVSTVILISGWAVIGISVLLFVLSLISYISASKKIEDAEPIETVAEDIEEE